MLYKLKTLWYDSWLYTWFFATLDEWYRPTQAWRFQPDSFLQEIDIPAKVDTFMDVGCGAGRNMVPFNGKLKLWGVDIVPFRDIRWVAQFTNFSYWKLSIQELTAVLLEDKLDLSKTLVYTGCVLMYIPKADQEAFVNALHASGCTNYIFHEPRPDSIKHPTQHFKLPQSQFNYKQGVGIDKGYYYKIG